MSDAENSLRIQFSARFRHGVDEKRRVQVPAKWRPDRQGMEFTLILWPKPGVGSCIRGMLPDKMVDLVRYLDSMANGDPNKTVLKRIIGSESMQVTLDKAGRLCLPDEMAREAGIQNEAVLVGLLDRFEIWSPDRYEKVKASDAVMATEAFKLME